MTLVYVALACIMFPITQLAWLVLLRWMAGSGASNLPVQATERGEYPPDPYFVCNDR